MGVGKEDKKFQHQPVIADLAPNEGRQCLIWRGGGGEVTVIWEIGRKGKVASMGERQCGTHDTTNNMMRLKSM